MYNNIFLHLFLQFKYGTEYINALKMNNDYIFVTYIIYILIMLCGKKLLKLIQ